MKIRIAALFYSLIICTAFAQNPNDANTSAKYEGPIIDMHIHAYKTGNPLLGLTHPPTLRGETYEGVATPEELRDKTIEILKKYNVVKAVVTNGEAWSDFAPDIVLTSSSGPNIEELRKKHSDGNLKAIAEMAPFYQGKLATDPEVMPYFQLAEELGIPVGFHIFPGGPNNGIHLMPQMLGGMRTYNASPLQLEDVLVKLSDLKIYIMHGGWPFVDEVKALMYAHNNLYVDIAVLNWILPKEECYSYLKSLINAGFGDRIMHGTDQMVWPQLIEVGIETINSADFLTWEQKEDIFYDNAAAFLGLSEEEITIHKRN